MAGIFAVQAALDVTSLDGMREYTMMHKGDEVIPLYMRQAMGGTVQIEGLRTGTHTICAIFGNPMTADPATIKFKCTQAKLAGAKQTATVVVPAAWFEEAK
jgi:hypothetical protein